MCHHILQSGFVYRQMHSCFTQYSCVYIITKSMKNGIVSLPHNSTLLHHNLSNEAGRRTLVN